MASIVTRDGVPVSPVLPDEGAAHKWLQDHQGQSNDWAIRHEGWAIIDAPPESAGSADDGE